MLEVATTLRAEHMGVLYCMLRPAGGSNGGQRDRQGSHGQIGLESARWRWTGQVSEAAGQGAGEEASVWCSADSGP
jgi:hypothetical protein